MIDEFMCIPDTRGVREMDSYIKMHYPKIQKTMVGKSILGKEINAYIFGEGRRRVAYFGTHHASESITCNLLFTFIDKFSSRLLSGGREEGDLYRMFTYVIVPLLNPDGTEIALHGADSSPLAEREKRMLEESHGPWQANARGVDLNHNYDYRFFEYKRIERDRGITNGATLFGGEYPESEPETKAAARLVRASSPSGILSFHSQGEEIFHLDDPRLRRIAGRMAKLSGYTPRVADGTAAYGGLADYSSSIGIPSFTVEVGKGKNPLPLSDLPSISSKLYPLMLRFPTLL